MRITITLPRVQANQLVSNLLGSGGLLGLVVAVGGLTGNPWWSLALGAVIAVALSWVANTHAQAAVRAAAAAASAPAAASFDGVPALRVAGSLPPVPASAATRPAAVERSA